MIEGADGLRNVDLFEQSDEKYVQLEKTQPEGASDSLCGGEIICSRERMSDM